MSEHPLATANISTSAPIDPRLLAPIAIHTSNMSAITEDSSQFLGSPMDMSSNPYSQPITMQTPLPTGTSTVPSIPRMFSPNIENFDKNPFASLARTENNNPGLQASNFSTSPVFAPSDAAFISNLFTSHAGLSITQGVRPHVTLASCIPMSIAQYVENSYKAKRNADQEQQRTGKKSRVEDTMPSVTQNNGSVSAERKVLPQQASSNAPLNSQIPPQPKPSGSGPQPSQALITNHINRTMESPTNQQIMIQQLEQSGQLPAMTQEQRKFFDFVAQLYDKDFRAVRERLNFETLTDIRVFFRHNKGSTSSESSSIPQFKFFMFHVTTFGTYDIEFEPDVVQLARKVNSRLQEIKETILDNCALPSSILTCKEYGLDITINSATTKILNGTIVSVFKDGKDHNIFGVVFKKNEGSSNLSITVISTYRRLTADQIVELIQDNVITGNKHQRIEIKRILL